MTPCCGNFKDRLSQVTLGIASVVWRSLVFGLALALVWGLVDWMRNYNQTPLLFPFANFAANQECFAPSDKTLTWFNQAVSFYNIAFPGACRLGSGIGIIAGACWACLQRSCAHQRLAAGITAGALIGGRTLLMFSSNAELCLFSTGAGAVIVGIYMWHYGGPPKIPDLPLVTEIEYLPVTVHRK